MKSILTIVFSLLSTAALAGPECEVLKDWIGTYKLVESSCENTFQDSATLSVSNKGAEKGFLFEYKIFGVYIGLTEKSDVSCMGHHGAVLAQVTNPEKWNLVFYENFLNFQQGECYGRYERAD